MKFYPDSTKSLKKTFEKVMDRYFKEAHLDLAKIQYVFWEGEKTTGDGRVVHGETRIPSARERDIYGYDFIISISGDYWEDEASTADKIRLTYHELKHCKIECTKSTKGKIIPKRDKEGRLKVRIRPHDVNLNLFLSEVEVVGLSGGEYKYIEDLHMISKSNNGRRKKVKKVKKRRK